MTSSASEKILLIDCDPGVDDCAALMMVMKQVPTVRIVGITCAAGNVGLDKVLMNIARIAKLCGLLDQIPIFRGCKNPLVAMPKTEDATFFHGHDGLGDVPDVPPRASPELLTHVQTERAVDAIIRLSKEYAGRLQLVCLGALTNIAMAERMDPTLPSRVKSVHILGGTIRGYGNVTPCAEYNFYTDPEAAYNVLRQFTPHSRTQIVTYEITLDYGVTPDWFNNAVAGSGKRATFYRSVFNYTRAAEDGQIALGVQKGYSPCDAYLMAVVLDPTIITKSKMVHMGVELGGDISRGSLVIDHKNEGSPHLSPNAIELIEELNEDKFKALFAQSFVD